MHFTLLWIIPWISNGHVVLWSSLRSTRYHSCLPSYIYNGGELTDFFWWSLNILVMGRHGSHVCYCMWVCLCTSIPVHEAYLVLCICLVFIWTCINFHSLFVVLHCKASGIWKVLVCAVMHCISNQSQTGWNFMWYKCLNVIDLNMMAVCEQCVIVYC